MADGYRGFNELVCADLDGTWWRLYEDLTYDAEDGAVYVVPAGFLTDLASIPRIFWTIYPRSGQWNEAAVLHDFLYRRGHRDRDIIRAEVDALFLEGMAWLQVPVLVRRQFYWGVRLGGAKAWQRGE